MINLVKESCSHLLFKTRVELNQSMIDMVNNEFDVGLGKRRRWNFEERVAVGDWVEYAQVSFEKVPRTKTDYEIEFHFDAHKRKRKPANISEEHQKTLRVLGILTKSSLNLDFDCEANFEYAPPSAQGLFPIKAKLLEQNVPAFDEIRGITVAKIDDGKVTYTVTLESLDLEELLLLVDFGHTASFSKDLPDVILREASSIKSKFVN